MRLVTVHVDDLEQLPEADAAVVIDVLRAFTVAPWCFARGARDLLLAASIEAAVAGRSREADVLLLKDGAPDERFDLPNAPGYIAATDLSGRAVIQKTGNGTRGAHAVAGVPTALCASFVTAAATARVLRTLDVPTVALVVTEGDEDVALADYLRAHLADPLVDPAPYLQRAGASAAAVELRRRGPDPAFPGVHPNDVPLSLELDRFDFALRAVPDGAFLRLLRC